MPRPAPALLLSTLALAICGCLSDADTPSPGNSSAAATDTTGGRENRSSGNLARSRTFELDYGVTLKEIPRGARVRVWFPVPPTTKHQVVRLADRRNVPVRPRETAETKYGNRILHFDLTSSSAEPLIFELTWEVTRTEIRGMTQPDPVETLDGARRTAFLEANTNVPIDGKPLTLVDSSRLPKDDPLQLARALYDRVDGHMRYDKSKPGYGNGDALWACDSGFGNCTDFHSLFISLTRSRKIPAKFEIGFPLPPQRGEGAIGGYHCWAQFFVDGHGWVPTDISEADRHPEMKDYYFGNLTENRVMFTTGRDITLVPRQSGAALNYFVYPYVEVDGQVWSAEKTEPKFGYRDKRSRSAAATSAAG